MTEEQLKNKADELWYYYEQSLFENSGNFSYKTNLVFAFADYVDCLSDDDLSDLLGDASPQSAKAFRLMPHFKTV